MGGGDRRDREDRSDEYVERTPSREAVTAAQRRLDAFAEGATDTETETDTDPDTEADTDTASDADSESAGGGAFSIPSSPDVSGIYGMDTDSVGPGESPEPGEESGESPESGADADRASADDGPESGSESPSESDGESEGGEPNAGEWAREHLTEGNIADRHLSGGEGGQRAHPIEEASTGRIGGWDEYDGGETSSQPLNETGGRTGRTSHYMDRVDLSGETAAEAGADTAFVTHYTDDARPGTDGDPPHRECANSQMAVYAFADALGAKVPRHTYHRDEEWVAVEGVPGKAAAEWRFHDDEARARTVTRNVDREQFIEMNAIQLLAGNRDLHGANVFIEPDGSVQCVDTDLGGRGFNDFDGCVRMANKAAAASDKIAQARGDIGDKDEEFVVDNEEIAERAREIAVALDESGRDEAAIAAMKAYDDFFDGVRRDYHETARENIDALVESDTS